MKLYTTFICVVVALVASLWIAQVNSLPTNEEKGDFITVATDHEELASFEDGESKENAATDSTDLLMEDSPIEEGRTFEHIKKVTKKPWQFVSKWAHKFGYWMDPTYVYEFIKPGHQVHYGSYGIYKPEKSDVADDYAYQTKEIGIQDQITDGETVKVDLW